MNNSKTIAYGILRATGIIVGILLFLFFLYQIQAVLLYIAIAAVISLMGRPLVLFFKRRLKFNNSIAVIGTLFLIIILFFSLFLLFVPIISEQGQLIGKIDMDEVGSDINKLNEEISNYFQIEKLDIPRLLKQKSITKMIGFKSVSGIINTLFSGFGAGLIGLFSVLFISFFFLKDSHLLQKSILVFVKKDNETRFTRAFSKIKNLLSRYFVGLLLQILILFVLYTIVLLIFGVNNAIAVALIAAIFNLIPYIGPVFGGVFILILATTSQLGENFSSVILPNLTYIFIGYGIIQVIDNFLNQPLIFGNSVKSHPLEIFLAILIFGALFGIGGLIIAIPFYTALKVIAKEFLSEYKIVKQLTKEL